MKNNSFSTILTFVGGVAVGAAAMLFLASKQGEEFRHKLNEKIQDLQNSLNDDEKNAADAEKQEDK